MIIHDVRQGSTEWNELRAGIPTSSQFHRILTAGGKKSEQRDIYKFTLLAERMLGKPLEPYKSLPMQHGSRTEAEAADWYELQRDVTTEVVGFVTNDEGTIGCSPDRFVEEASGRQGTVEFKCPEAWTHVSYLLRQGGAYDKYKIQCNGQLWICVRDFTDIMSYYSGLPEALHRIERDEKFLRLLAEAVMEFSADLEATWAKVLADGLLARPDMKRPAVEDGYSHDALLRALKESLIEINK